MTMDLLDDDDYDLLDDDDRAKCCSRTTALFFAVVSCAAMCAIIVAGLLVLTTARDDGLVIKLGILLDKRGSSSDWAVQLALNRLKEESSLANAGYRYSSMVRYLDDADVDDKKEAAIEALTDFSGQSASVVIGPLDSETVQNILPSASARKLVLVSPTSSTENFNVPRTGLFRLYPSDQHQALAIAQLIQAQGYTDGVILARTNVYGNYLSRELKDNWRGNVSATVHYKLASDINATNFGPYLEPLAQHINSHGKCAFVCICGSEEFALILNTMKKMDWPAEKTGMFVSDASTGSHAAITRDLYNFSLRVGITGILPHVETENNPLYDAVDEAWTLGNISGPLLSSVVNSFDAVMLANKALSAFAHTSEPDYGSLLSALGYESMYYSGASGQAAFDGNGDRRNTAYDIYIIKANHTSNTAMWKKTSKLTIGDGCDRR